MRRVALVAAILAGLLLRTPSPDTHLIDPDHGQQLAGAQQIAGGEHPFVDFRSTYGPLSYYPSAGAQIVFSNRIAADMALGVLGYLVAYLCLFVVARRLTGRRWIAWACTAVAVLLAPSMYKYYIAAGPMVVLVASHRYIDRPGMLRLLLLACAVAVAGLFRADYGAYTALTACAAIVLAEPRGGRRWRALLVWAMFVVACALPWLIFVSVKGGLGEYLYSSTWGTLVQTRSLALPLPWPNPARLFAVSNARFISFVYFLLLPAACVALVWRTRRSPNAGDWRMVGVTAILAQLTLLQSVHRSDHRHLVEAIPVSLALVAWFTAIATKAMRQENGPLRFAGMAGLAATVMAVGAASAAAIELRDIEVASPQSVSRWWAEYSGTRAALVDAVHRRDPENWQAAAIQYIRRCTAPHERVLALPLLTSYYHLAERRFAGGHMYISPGFFNEDAYQHRVIAMLESQEARVIIEMPGGIDRREERQIKRMAPIVAAYFDERYAEAGRIGKLRVRIHRDWLPHGAPRPAGEQPPCPARPAISAVHPRRAGVR